MTALIDPDASEPARKSMLARALDTVPRILASRAHIIWLFVLLLWIVILAVPFPSIASARVELILGNYTNVTSDLGACIAAGGTVALVRHSRRQSRLAAERHQMTTEIHRLLHAAHPQTAKALGQQPWGQSGAPTGSTSESDG
ncbi:MAG: hypothetical protein ACYCXA_03965 [Actinomycetes bacterium]